MSFWDHCLLEQAQGRESMNQSCLDAIGFGIAWAPDLMDQWDLAL